MWQDPIVAETHALREEYSQQFNHDADAIYQDIMTKQATHKNMVVSFQPRKVKIAQQVAQADAAR